VPNFVAIAPTVADILRFFDISRWQLPPSWIFKMLKILTVGTVKMVELFRGDRSNRCGDMAIFSLSWIFQFSKF